MAMINKKILWIIVIGSLVSGCTASKNPPAPSVADVTEQDYLIGPSDQLNIVVWRNPEVSQSVPVRPDGKISTPLVEDLPAIGKTSTELARDLEKALAKYIQEPVVTVIVQGFVGPYTEQIRVIGQATRPQALPYRKNMTLLDVMIAVGGITDFASGNNATLVRGNRQQQFNIRLNDLLKRGDVSANVEVRPGDVIVIPEGIF